MELFIGHKITEGRDGYTVVLYLDPQPSEFAKEFGDGDSEDRKSLEKAIQEYIKGKLPDIKVKAVEIMLGTFLIASIPFGNVDAAAYTGGYHVQGQTADYYTVRQGDTLLGIAKRFGTTVDRLKHTNRLTGDIIYPGQILKIPQRYQSVYIVKSGDTLFKIAKQFDMTVRQLKLANRLRTDIIYVGQTIYIPEPQTVSVVNGLPDGVYRLGDYGEGVKRIQRALNAYGYSLVEDGIFGSKTERVVVDFQQQYQGLADDGIYGPGTKWHLEYALLTDHIIVPNPDDFLVLVNKYRALPSDYVPGNLVVPNVPFPFEEYHPKKLMRQDAAWALEELFQKAQQENIELYAVSGYRSYQRQKDIFSSKAMKYGIAEANKFSAKPGESEHQTGLAMDVTSKGVDFKLSLGFGETQEGKWLAENAPDFGFILRYPKGKEHITGYQYEPWHIRFVGRYAAGEITKNNLTLEGYLGAS